MDRISTNVNRTLGFLKGSIGAEGAAVRAAACRALVRPRVECASTVWGPFTRACINKIEVVQGGPCAGSAAAVPRVPVCLTP